MSIVNVKLRKLVNWYHQKQLKNHDFSIIASNCKGFEQQDKLGNLYEYRHRFTGFKYYDQFNYVKWLNG